VDICVWRWSVVQRRVYCILYSYSNSIRCCIAEKNVCTKLMLVFSLLKVLLFLSFECLQCLSYSHKLNCRRTNSAICNLFHCVVTNCTRGSWCLYMITLTDARPDTARRSAIIFRMVPGRLYTKESNLYRNYNSLS